jgi:uncharacterized membrane protein
MVCVKSCSFAVVFITSMVFLNFMTYLYNPADKLTQVLDETQLEKYNKIKSERKMTHIKGLVYGLILAYLSTTVIKVRGYNKLCYLIAAAYIFMYFYYMLIPKSDYLILHLNMPEQKKRWLDNYKFMQFNYNLGLLLGVVLSMLLAFKVINFDPTNSKSLRK